MTTHWLDRPRKGLALTLALVGIGGAWQFNSQLTELNRDAANRDRVIAQMREDKDRELNQVHSEIVELRKSNCRRPNE